MKVNRFIKNLVKDRVEVMKMKPPASYRVMWTLVDGSELGVEVEAAEQDTDERIRELAWQQIILWTHPVLRPRNKSDMRVIRRPKT